jgi:hypothetical protein
MQLDLTQLLTRILGATLIMIGCATAQTAGVQFSLAAHFVLLPPLLLQIKTQTDFV